MENFTESELLKHRPALYNFAYRLCRNTADAEDLVQDTLIKAITKQDRFTPGSKLIAWLYTILKNTFLAKKRKVHRLVEDAEGYHTGTLVAPDNQLAAIEAKQVLLQMRYLPMNMRKALIAVALHGGKYEEAAKSLGVTVGTIKSRINRAREHLENGTFQDISEDEFEAQPVAPVVEEGPDNTKWYDTIRILFINSEMDVSGIAAKTGLTKLEIMDAIAAMNLKRKKVKTP